MGMKVGIIGCGSIAKFRHAPEYRAHAQVDEIIFYDRHPERAQALAKEFGGRTVQTIEELLCNPEVIAVSDCSSNDAHHIYTASALLHGKHVLCEKPLAICVKHGEEILKAERKSGKILMVAHNQRFAKAHQKAKMMLQKQTLGKVLTFSTHFQHGGPESWGVDKSKGTWFFKKERSGSGVVGDLGIHKIDLIHYLLDDEIEDVLSFSGTLDKVNEMGEPIDVPDNVICALRTRKGRLGTAVFSWTNYGTEDHSTIIYCQEGVIKLYQDSVHPLIIEEKDGTIIKYEIEHIQTNEQQTNTGIIDAFITSIVNNTKPPVTGTDALAAMKIIEKILQS